MATLLWVSCSVRGCGASLGAKPTRCGSTAGQTGRWVRILQCRWVEALLQVSCSARGHKGALLKAKPTGPMSAVSPQGACQSGPCTIMVVM